MEISALVALIVPLISTAITTNKIIAAVVLLIIIIAAVAWWMSRRRGASEARGRERRGLKPEIDDGSGEQERQAEAHGPASPA